MNRVSEFDHIILTRFNVRVPDVQSRPTDGWLRDRITLFEKYCVTSLARQSSSNFVWLVFLDSDSPDWLRAELRKLSDRGRLFTAVYLNEEFGPRAVTKEVRRHLQRPFLITTRIDNDDAVAIDFVQRIQASFNRQTREFVNFPDGAQLRDGRVYRRPYTLNPFISLVESALDPITVFVDQHPMLAAHASVRNVRSSHPMWLQIVHGENIANEVVGLRMRAIGLAPWFHVQAGQHDTFPQFIGDWIRGVMRIALRLVRKPSRLLELVKASGRGD